MPFGLRNAAQTFQRFIDHVLSGLTFCYAYLDDILVASPDPEQHHDHLRQVFSRLQDHGLRINPDKCVWGANLLDFLGFQVDQHGIRSLEVKVQAIREFPLPPTQHKLRQFLGLVNFYHRFLPNCALILQPLHDLLKGAPKGNTPLTWTDAATKAFHTIKDALADATLLVHPRPNAPTCILTDASSAAVGAVLQQRIGDTWCPLAYFSRKLTPARPSTAPLIESCWPFTWPSNTFSTLSKAVTSMSAQTTSLSRLLSLPVSTSTPLRKPGTWTSFHSSPWISDMCQDTTMQQLTPSPAWMLMLWGTPPIQPGISTHWLRHNMRMTVQQQIPLPTTDVTLLCDMSTGTSRPLTAAANLSLACGPNSWLSWVSTVQGQLLTIPALMDWWKDSIANLKQH